MPRILCDRKKDEFLALMQGSMSVATIEDEFHAMSRYGTQLLGIDEESIQLYVKGLNIDLQVLSIRMSFV